MKVRRFSQIIFISILICFLLPWLQLEYFIPGISLIARSSSFSGLQLCIGVTFGPKKYNLYDLKEPLIFFVFLSGLLGFVFSFLRQIKIGAIGSAIMGVIGTIFLFLSKLKIDKYLVEEVSFMVAVDYLLWFYLTLLLLIFAVVINIYSIISGGESIPLFESGYMCGNKFCPECGANNTADSQFCKKCGTKLST